MHVDYLNVTVPETVSQQVSKGVLEVLDMVGNCEKSPGRYQVGESGSVMLTERRGFTFYGLSGNALHHIRQHKLYPNLLWAFAEGPHRVTSMDIAMDRLTDPRPILKRLWRRSMGPEGVRLTRKRIPDKGISKVEVPCHYDSGSTGTLYLGKRTSEVHLKIYDKRNQLIDTGRGDPGHHVTRYELTVTSKMGISLGDAASPEPLFWHFMRDVLKPPADVPEWASQGEGYTLPPREEIMAADKLKRTIDESPELRRWIAMADDVGPEGRNYLLALLGRHVKDRTDDSDRQQRLFGKDAG